VTPDGGQRRLVEPGGFPKGFTSCVKVAALATSWVFQEFLTVRSGRKNGVIRFRANTKIRPLWFNSHNTTCVVPREGFPKRGSACAQLFSEFTPRSVVVPSRKESRWQTAVCQTQGLTTLKLEEQVPFNLRRYLRRQARHSHVWYPSVQSRWGVYGVSPQHPNLINSGLSCEGKGSAQLPSTSSFSRGCGFYQSVNAKLSTWR